MAQCLALRQAPPCKPDFKNGRPTRTPIVLRGGRQTSQSSGAFSASRRRRPISVVQIAMLSSILTALRLVRLHLKSPFHFRCTGWPLSKNHGFAQTNPRAVSHGGLKHKSWRSCRHCRVRLSPGEECSQAQPMKRANSPSVDQMAPRRIAAKQRVPPARCTSFLSVYLRR